ncbi:MULTISPECIES: hypothetical protein [unclassified Streptomyces]|uniref:hypothetical protein n=1 Tax=unclassified Streptomyces TaxID=2593676 RepID=UPI002E33451B|nr:hypothetical protein [Streptomyces sp. NBC_01460]WSS28943.1 hypothetical protein OG770_23305 [Streptomyces sp. NBC_01185]
MTVHGSTRPRNGRTGGAISPSPRGARTALRNCAKGVLVLTLALGATTACGPFSDSGSGSSKRGGGSSGGGSHAAKDWKVGDCAGPDTSESKDGFQPLDCDDPKATIKALEVKDGEMFAGAVECPAGTDEIISVKVSFGGDASAGLPSKTICGRNLSDDHPGDAGAGGGQLVVGDCVDDQAKEVACASGGSKVLALTKTAEECPAAADNPIELFPSPGRPYDAICTSKA